MAASKSVSANLSTFLRRYPCVWFSAAWIVGTLLAHRLTGLSITNLWTIAGITIFLAVVSALRRSEWLWSLPAFLVIVLIASLAARKHAPIQDDSLSSIAKRKDQPIMLRGVVSTVASWRPATSAFGDQREHEQHSHLPEDRQPDRWFTQWTVEWSQVRVGTSWEPIQCRANLYVNGRLDSHLPGDQIEVIGSFRQIGPASNPGMRGFVENSQRNQKFVVVHADGAEQIRHLSSTWQYFPSRMRAKAVWLVDSLLYRYVSHQQAPLSAALVFGQPEQIDWDDKEQLLATGTIHILSVSGLHVELVGSVLLLICLILNLRPKPMLLTILATVFLYSCLAGGNPPVLRAMVQAAAIAIARYFGWQHRLPNLLGLAAVFVLMINPNNIFNVGVYLSFLSVATIGVFILAPAGRPGLRSALRELIHASQSPFRRWLENSLLIPMMSLKMSLWVWLMNVPIVWHQFNVLSPIAIPLNVTIAPFLLVGLVAGLVTGFLGWIPPIGWLSGTIAGINLMWINQLVEIAYRVPWGHVWLPSPPIWWSIAFYAFTAVWLMVFRLSYRRTLATFLLIWIAIGVLLFVPGPRGLSGSPSSTCDSPLRCTFLDVGHGTSVLIELPDGRLWLYDAGHFGDDQRSHQLIAPSIWNLKAARIDTLIISHADSDHYNAVMGLVERFQIGRVASTQRFWASDEPAIIAIREMLDRKGIPRIQWDSTSKADAGQCSVQTELLHPPPVFQAESDNADSLVLQLEYAGVRVLLTGDIEGSGMLAVCERLRAQKPHCDVLMAPHHGSLSHDPKELMDVCQPKVVVISGGDRSIRPEVALKYASAGILGISFRDHAIQVRIDANGITQTDRWDGDSWTKLK